MRAHRHTDPTARSAPAAVGRGEGGGAPAPPGTVEEAPHGEWGLATMKEGGRGGGSSGRMREEEG